VFEDVRVVIRGAGDLATGVAARLWRAGFRVVMTELERPLAIRRSVALSEAIYDGTAQVEDLRGRRVAGLTEIEQAWAEGVIPVVADATGQTLALVKPQVVVDATLAKRNLGTQLSDAPLVIGLGPGFTAGVDVNAVVETNRGHYLGRVMWSGSAQPDTKVPGVVNDVGRERVIYAPAAGVFRHQVPIGAAVEPGEIVGWLDQTPVMAGIGGIVRGLLHDGVRVDATTKIGDVDPRGVVDHCWTISDKALALGGGVLEAILTHWHQAHP
jgi:xanthine dehydrogenase accessory factor